MKQFRIDASAHAEPPTLHVKAGEKVAIKLEGAGTTGYEWQVSESPAGFEVIDHQVEPDLKSFGAAGTDKFVVSAERGTHDVTLDLKAPWESTPAKSIRLNIESD